MRYRDLLLEYDRQKTIENWMPRLRARILQDPSIRGQDFMVGLDIARRIYREAKKFPDRPLDPAADAEVMHFIEQCDPTARTTKHYPYVIWIVQRYVKGDIALAEDLRSKVEPWLATHYGLKQSGWFRRNPEHRHFADIGQFKTLTDLGQFILSIKPDDSVSNAEADRRLKAKLIASKQVEIIMDTPTVQVVIPRTWEAAKYFGRNTQWCTSGEVSDGDFKTYTEIGPLYIILDKPNNRRWQFHFESGQFMDEQDEQIDTWNDVPEEALGFINPEALSPMARIYVMTRVFDAEIKKKVAALATTNEIAVATIFAPAWRKELSERLPPFTAEKYGVSGEGYQFGNNLAAAIWHLTGLLDDLEYQLPDDYETPLTQIMRAYRDDWGDSAYLSIREAFDTTINVVSIEAGDTAYLAFFERNNHYPCLTYYDIDVNTASVHCDTVCDQSGKALKNAAKKNAIFRFLLKPYEGMADHEFNNLLLSDEERAMLARATKGQ